MSGGVSRGHDFVFAANDDFEILGAFGVGTVWYPKEKKDDLVVRFRLRWQFEVTHSRVHVAKSCSQAQHELVRLS